jgi:hypothetical protein
MAENKIKVEELLKTYDDLLTRKDGFKEQVCDTKTDNLKLEHELEMLDEEIKNMQTMIDNGMMQEEDIIDKIPANSNANTDELHQIKM